MRADSGSGSGADAVQEPGDHAPGDHAPGDLTSDEPASDEPAPDDQAQADRGSADLEAVIARQRELISGLSRRRVASGLSQADVAGAMQTSQSAVARLESGQHDTQVSTLARYAGALGLSLSFVDEAEARRQGPGSGADIPRPKGRPGRKPKGSEPAVILDTPDKPDPDHVLTWRQRKVLHVIREYVQRRGYPPSTREIGEAVGLTSTSAVIYQLRTLQSKGYLRRDMGRARAVEVRLPNEAAATTVPGLDLPSQEAAYVPLVGRIAAGRPILAEEQVEEIFALPRRLVGEGDLFLLKVAGDSMIDAAIADGDFVVVRQQSRAEPGEIVAALLDGEVTVKTYRQSGGHAWLIPHNPDYAPILGDEASILGRVVALLRRV